VICRHLRQLVAIRLLILDDNSLTDQSTPHLAEWIRDAPHVRTLSLQSNFFTKIGLGRVIDVLPFNQSILEVFVGNNKLPIGYDVREMDGIAHVEYLIKKILDPRRTVLGLQPLQYNA